MAKTNPKTEKSIRAQLLSDAIDLIDGDRHNDYGSAIDDFACIAEFWQTYLTRTILRRGKLDIAGHDVAIMMNLLKTSRIGWNPQKRDSWLDTNGYAGTGWECVVADHFRSTEKS